MNLWQRPLSNAVLKMSYQGHGPVETQRHLEAIWPRLGGFGGRSAGAKTAPSLVRGRFGPVFARFYGVFLEV